MSDLEFVYAVARIRVLEKNLLTDADIEQMIASDGEARVLSFLKERGWGNADGSGDAAEVLSAETAKTWKLMEELKIDPKVFEVFSYQTIYHNLKAAIKEVCTGDVHPGIFIGHETLGEEEMLRIVREKDWKALPEHMQAAAQEAYEALLTTRDGQLCDILIDRATLDAIGKAGKKAKQPIIRDYAGMFVDVADIRIAARAAKTGKSREFLARALATCGSLDREKLIIAAAAGPEEVSAFLRGTKYADAAEALEESPSAFERWCDDQVIETIRPQKYNAFSVGPVVAYLLARENEIRMARIILTAKANELPDAAIRERARKMYV